MVNPLISIIVPVFNVENYIENCILSVVNQNYQNWELILVDDGSTDNTHEVLKLWENKDKRVIVIWQKNSGVSIARNSGINAARGEYIMFIDSDDWIDYSTLNECVNLLNLGKFDLILFGWKKTYNSTEVKERYLFDEGITLFEKPGFEYRRRSIGMLSSEMKNPVKTDIYNTPWAKLILADLIRNNNLQFQNRYEVGMEDVLFMIQLFQYVQSPKLLNQYLYYYRQDNENSLSKIDGDQLVTRFKKLFEMIRGSFNSSYSEYNKALNNRIALSVINIYFNICSNRKHISSWERIRQIKSLVSTAPFKDALKSLELKYLPLHWKVLFYLTKVKASILIYFIVNVMKLLR